MDNLIVHRVGMKGQRIAQVCFKIFSLYVNLVVFLVRNSLFSGDLNLPSYWTSYI